MAKVTTYKNSKLASACSIIGYILIVCCVYLLFQKEVSIGIGFAVAGIAFKILGAVISVLISKKEQKKKQKLQENQENQENQNA